MSKFRKKPVVIEATLWVEHGDHPAVQPYTAAGYCFSCGRRRTDHGWINTLEGGHIVCPGDWIITGVKGEHYPCKPDVFERTYELVEEAEAAGAR